MQRKIHSSVFFGLIVVLLFGCNNDKVTEKVEVENEFDTVQYIDGWKEEYLVRTEDSLVSSLTTVLRYYGHLDADLSEPLSIASFPLYGVSYLPLLAQLGQQYGLHSTIVDGSFDLTVVEIDAHRPVIAKRLIRNISEDYLLIIGYDAATSELIGFSYTSKEPVRVTKSRWEQEFVEEGIRWSIIFADDRERLDSLHSNSVSYWIQRGVELLYQKNYDALGEAIQQFDRLNIRISPANNMRDFYYLIQRHQVPQEVDDHTDLLYEVAPDLSFSIEFMFWKHWIREEREQALEFLTRMEKLNLFHENHSETLQLFREIYVDQHNREQVEMLDVILLERGDQ